MPITLGTNLEKTGNKISAKYTDMFSKLNVAKAWTHTQSTSTGTVAFIKPGSTDIYYIENCNDYTSVYIGNGGDAGKVDVVTCVIDGKLFLGTTPTQYGSSTNWKESSGQFALDNDGGLWLYNSSTNSYSQILTDKNWVKLSKTSGPAYSIDSNGYLYCLYNSTQVGTLSGWTDVSSEFSNGVKGICNGYLYDITNYTTATLLDSSRNNYVQVINDDGYYAALTSSGEVYRSGNFTTPIITNVKKMYRGLAGGGLYIYYITNNNALYMSSGSSGNVTLLNNTMSWDSVIGILQNYFYGVADGKLYYVTNITSTPTYTQIGSETNYKNVDGNASLFIATLSSGTTISHTVYTTKTQTIGDNTYIDTDLTKYSKITAVTSVSITDSYGTYNRDAVNDSSFSGIPEETINENVSIADVLRITNPNT